MSGPFGSQHWMYASGFYGHTINQSLRFEDGDSPNLTFSPSSSGNRKTWTLSLWVKRANITGAYRPFFSAGTSATSWALMFSNAEELFIQSRSSSSNQFIQKTANLFRDVSAWYHIVYEFDTTQATDTNRSKLYVNGEQITLLQHTTNPIYPSQNTDYHVNNSSLTHYIGYGTTHNGYLDGYLAEVNFIDGIALDADNFGETKNGVWIPKAYSGSYGTYGWHLDFADSSDIGNNANTTDGTNDWSVNNLVASDVVPDSPTNNWSTMNPLDKNSMTVSEGNLKVVPSGDYKAIRGTFGIPTSGKWYFEARILTPGGGNVQDNQIGVVTASNVLTGSSPYPQAFTYGVGYLGLGQINRAGSSSQSSLTAFTAGKILGVAVNVDDDEVQFYLDGSAVGSTEQLVSTTEPNFPFYVGATNRGVIFNFGQDSTFTGAISAGGNADANGIGDFAYAPPANHLALCASNLSDSTLGPNSEEQAEDYFKTVLYAGTGSTQSITGIFQPDFVWIKARDGAGSGRQHMLFDSVRGATKVLRSHLKNSEVTVATSLTSFNSDGFTIGSDSDVNTTSENFVAWNWKAGGATPRKTYKVHVDSDGGQNKYRFRNSADNATFATYAPTVELQEGGTYVFDWSHSTAQGHPIRFSTTSDGTHGGGAEYTTGVVKDDSAYTTTITVASGAPTLYYYCQNHSGMGGQVNTNSTFGSSNFDGTIQSTVSASQKAGFSIVNYTGNGIDGATIGHGLSQAPNLIINKSLDSGVREWWVAGYPTTSIFPFDGSNVRLSETNNMVQSLSAELSLDASVITIVDSGQNNVSSDNRICYCFQNIEGYSKIGSYTGNGSTDGTFVYTGFRPSWVLWKQTTGTTGWFLMDSTRDTENVTNTFIRPNETTPEATAVNSIADFLSNGFKLRGTGGDVNTNTKSYLYIAFAEIPFKYANAR